jgi:hypothetical protein
LSAASRLRSILRTLAEWLLVVGVTLLIGEGLARMAGVRPLTAADSLWRAHERWGWHHEPNSVDWFVKTDFTQEIRINSHGLREREIPYEKPAGKLRILVLGDSAVAGFEVKPEECFTRVLERELAARGIDAEVINGGTRGWGTDQSLLFLQDEGLRYAPDLVLYRWNPNDLQDNATIHRPFRRFAKPWFVPTGDGGVEPRGIPVPAYPYRENLRVDEEGAPEELPVALSNQIVLWFRDVFVCRSAFASWLTSVAIRAEALRNPMRAASSYNDTVDVAAAPSSDSEAFRVTAGLLRAMDRSAREAGARFAMTASLLGGDGVRAAAGLPALGDMERFQAKIRPGDVVTVPNDGHMNALGHRLYGEVLADVLVEDGYVGGPAVSANARPGAPPGR